MSSRKDSGHSKNVANFNTLVAFIMTYGTAYNPTKVAITTAALQSMSKNAADSIGSVNEAFSVYSSAVAARKSAFAPFSKLITRVSNALKATDTSVEVDNQARTIVRKLHGERAVPKKTNEEKDKLAADGIVVVEISAAQLSFNNRVANFEKLIALLAGIPLYIPNEQELNIAGLTSYYNELKVLNQDVITAFTRLSMARISRNKILYTAAHGLTDVALDAKVYIKSLYGATSLQYKQIGGLKFVPVKL